MCPLAHFQAVRLHYQLFFFNMHSRRAQAQQRVEGNEIDNWNYREVGNALLSFLHSMDMSHLKIV